MRLSEQHRQVLQASAIAPEIADARGYRTIDGPAELAPLGFKDYQRRTPGLLHPVWGVSGEVVGHQFRPDCPRHKEGKPIKYETPGGWRMHIDVPPGLASRLSDPTVPLLVTEGIRKADAAVSKGLYCIDLLGVWNWRGTLEDGSKGPLACWDQIALDGREVLIAFDSDVMRKPSVQSALAGLARFLLSRGACVQGVYLPDTPAGAKQGLDDFFAAGHNPEELRMLTKPLVAGDDETDRRRPSAGALVTKVAMDQCELFHSPDRVAYLSTAVGSRRSTFRVDSQDCEHWLRQLAFEKLPQKVLSAASVREAIDTLAAFAQFEGPTVPVFVRLAGRGRSIWIDLGTEDGAAVRVDATGWEVVATPPVRFIRPKDLRPLPAPARNGDVRALRPLLNLPSDDAFRLLVTAMVASLRPTGPYPLVVITGEQGSAKSMAARLFRRLTDPSAVELRRPPENEEDLIIAATTGSVVALDNLSRLGPQLSDALCRLLTGAGISKRQLYTDFGEASVSVCRPAVITSIGDVVTRGDLLDRSLTFVLPRIPDTRRQTESEVRAAFEAVAPSVFGGLLDILVYALAALPGVKMPWRPRLADFGELGFAAAPALGWTGEQFLASYDDNRTEGHSLVVEHDPVARALIQLIGARGEWHGTAGQLMEDLDPHGSRKGGPGWPASPRGMSSRLRQVAPSLAALGINVVTGERGNDRTRARLITVTAISPARQPSKPSNRPQQDGHPPDGTGANGPVPSEETRQPSNEREEPESKADGSDGSDGRDGNPLGDCPAPRIDALGPYRDPWAGRCHCAGCPACSPAPGNFCGAPTHHADRCRWCSSPPFATP